MNILLISSGPDIANLRYATGFTAPDPVVYVRKGRRGFLLVPLLEQGRALKEAVNTTVLTPEDIKLSPKKRSTAEWCVGLVTHLKINDLTVSENFPLSVAGELKKKKIRVAVCSGKLFPKREIKTADEIKKIKQSQRMAVRAMKAAIQTIRDAKVDSRKRLVLDGRALTSERVREVIEWTLLKKRCGTFDTIVAGGRQGADPHDSGSGPLRADQPIVLDIFPYHRDHGYYGDITRTVIKDAPSPELKKMYQTVLKAQLQALKSVRPGVNGAAIHQGVVDQFKDAGYETGFHKGVIQGFFHGTGHGVGLDIHESPSLSTRSNILKKGAIITVEPGLYYPRLGGIRIEDTVVVTEDGYEMLASCEKKFRV